MVKIGWAFQDVEGRRLILQCGHYETLSVIRTIDCEPWVERSMHRRFADRRVRGEWYRFHPDMLSVAIEDLELPAPARAADPIPLVADVESFLKETGMTPTAFGRRAVSDPALVHELRSGRECKRDIRTRITAFMESQRAGVVA